MRNHRARRIDGNQRQIVAELRDLGFSVFPTHTVGRGFPDLVVGKQGETFLVELKIRNGTLTVDQLAFAERWKGGVVIVARSTEEVLSGIEQQLQNSVRTYVS